MNLLQSTLNGAVISQSMTPMIKNQPPSLVGKKEIHEVNNFLVRLGKNYFELGLV